MKIAATNDCRHRAFTLVEMTGVLAVVAVLTAILVPKILETIEAPDATAITPSSANYDLDGVETNDGALICECVITGISADDAHSLKTIIDGSDPTALANLPAAGAATTKGRVNDDTIAAGATGPVLVYINHM